MLISFCKFLFAQHIVVITKFLYTGVGFYWLGGIINSYFITLALLRWRDPARRREKLRTDQKIFAVTVVQIQMNLWNREANIGLKTWVRITQMNRCPAINRRRDGYLIKQTNKKYIWLRITSAKFILWYQSSRCCYVAVA